MIFILILANKKVFKKWNLINLVFYLKIKNYYYKNF